MCGSLGGDVGLVGWGDDLGVEESWTGLTKSGAGKAGTGIGSWGKEGRLLEGNGIMFSVLGLVKSSKVGWLYFVGLYLRTTFLV